MRADPAAGVRDPVPPPIPGEAGRDEPVLPETPRPAAGLVYTDVVTMDAGGKALYTTEFPCPDEREACLRFLLRKNFINVSTALVRRDDREF